MATNNKHRLGGAYCLLPGVTARIAPISPISTTLSGVRSEADTIFCRQAITSIIVFLMGGAVNVAHTRKPLFEWFSRMRSATLIIRRTREKEHASYKKEI